jgi:hypothetical protein
MTKETFYLLARKPQKEGMEGPTIPFDDQWPKTSPGSTSWRFYYLPIAYNTHLPSAQHVCLWGTLSIQISVLPLAPKCSGPCHNVKCIQLVPKVSTVPALPKSPSPKSSDTQVKLSWVHPQNQKVMYFPDTTVG